MKEHRELIQFGTFYRLKSPFLHNSSAWMVVSPDRTEALAAYYRILEPVHGPFERIRLEGLAGTWDYMVKEPFAGGNADLGGHFGDELMYVGLSMSDTSSGLPEVSKERQGDYFSRLFYLKRKDLI